MVSFLHFLNFNSHCSVQHRILLPASKTENAEGNNSGGGDGSESENSDNESKSRGNSGNKIRRQCQLRDLVKTVRDRFRIVKG